MSLRQIATVVILLVLMFFSYSIVGQGTTTLILAFLFLMQAIVFTLRQEYFDKFLKFMNPRFYNGYIEKGEEFVKKKRKISIISYYILFILFTFNGFMQLKISPVGIEKQIFSIKEWIVLGLLIIFLGFVSNYFGRLIMKKSKTANEDLVWSLVLGVGIALLIVICTMFLIFKRIS